MVKTFIMFLVFAALCCSAPVFADEVGSCSTGGRRTIGGLTLNGHMKLYLADFTQGQRYGKVQYNNESAGIHQLITYIGKTISDTVSVWTEEKLSVSSSATPQLGSDIGRDTAAALSWTISQAYMLLRLPNDYEMKLGTMETMYSEQYGSEAWWDEQYHLNSSMSSIEAWPDNGIELYKNFDFGSGFNLPAYVYFINGSGRYVDTNQGKAVLTHFSPEFCCGKLRLLLSSGWGNWDTNSAQNMYKEAAGFDWKYTDKTYLMGEYFYQMSENLDVAMLTAGGARTKLVDGLTQAFYIRHGFKYNKFWKCYYEYSHIEKYAGNAAANAKSLIGQYISDNVLAIDYSIATESTIMAQFSFFDAVSNNGDNLNGIRFTLGWRTTF